MAFRQNQLQLSILGGVLSASPYFLVASPSLFGMLLTYLSTLPLFAVGLGLGFGSALVASLAGITCTVIISFLAGGIGIAVPYVLFNVAPTLLILFKILQYRVDSEGKAHAMPAEHIVNFLTWVGILVAGLGFILLNMMISGTGDNPSTLIESALGKQPPETMMILGQFLNVLPGLLSISWLIMVLSNAILAQGLLKAFGRNLRPSPDIADVYPFSIFYYLLAGAGVLSVMPLGVISTLAANLLFPLVIPFLLTGLGTVHIFARKFSYTSWILFGFYLIAFALSWPLILMIMVGVVEPWAKLRNRVA